MLLDILLQYLRILFDFAWISVFSQVDSAIKGEFSINLSSIADGVPFLIQDLKSARFLQLLIQAITIQKSLMNSPSYVLSGFLPCSNGDKGVFIGG